jgi:hypothetical protein
LFNPFHKRWLLSFESDLGCLLASLSKQTPFFSLGVGLFNSKPLQTIFPAKGLFGYSKGCYNAWEFLFCPGFWHVFL